MLQIQHGEYIQKVLKVVFFFVKALLTSSELYRPCTQDCIGVWAPLQLILSVPLKCLAQYMHGSGTSSIDQATVCEMWYWCFYLCMYHTWDWDFQSKTAFHKWLSYLLDFFWPIEPLYFWKVPLERFIHCGCGSSAVTTPFCTTPSFSASHQFLTEGLGSSQTTSLKFRKPDFHITHLVFNCLISPKSTFFSGLIFRVKLPHNLKSSS